MAAQTDISFGMKVEGSSTYGTGVTVDRFYPILPDPSFNYEHAVINTQALRVGGAGVPRAASRARTTSAGSGDAEFELATKGCGVLLGAVTGGTPSHTLVSGTTYQSNFTLGDLSSYTIQQGLVFADASGTRDPVTWLGAMCSGFEIDLPEGEIARLKTSWDLRDYVTNTAFATPSYATGTPYHWGIAGVTVGGTVTVPTTTALATGGTGVSNVRSFNVRVDHGLSGARNNIGAGGLKQKPYAGTRAITGTIVTEHDSATMRAAYKADTSLAIVLTMTSTEALSTGTATMQVVLPDCRLTGPMPTSAGGQVITTSWGFESLNDGTNAPLYVVLRTADTAI
jgi:hypothetical protein